MTFDLHSRFTADGAEIVLTGELDAAVAGRFREEVERAADRSIARLVLQMKDLTYMASAGLRVLIFARQKMNAVDIFIVGAQEAVRDTIEMSGFQYSVFMVDASDEDAPGARDL